MLIVASANSTRPYNMRGTKTISPSAAALEVILENGSAILDLESIFGRVAPLEVDLGCGDGKFLTTLAQQNLDRNFLGIDRMKGRVRSACTRIAQHGLSNARILRVETSHAIEGLLPAEGVSVFHLMFPDPWPKRRHAPRRVVTPEFCDSIYRTLVDDGMLRIATDQLDYYAVIEQAFANTNRFAKIAEPGVLAATRSTFEEHFIGAGAPIYRLLLRKISEPR
jgi:tRNA (guanine-N7-)-methyltransferase